MISFSLKVIFLGCLDAEVEGSGLLYNTGNYYQPIQHHTPEDINLLHHCCRNLNLVPLLFQFQWYKQFYFQGISREINLLKILYPSSPTECVLKFSVNFTKRKTMTASQTFLSYLLFHWAFSFQVTPHRLPNLLTLSTDVWYQLCCKSNHS